jgi:hypothetical protein
MFIYYIDVIYKFSIKWEASTLAGDLPLAFLVFGHYSGSFLSSVGMGLAPIRLKEFDQARGYQGPDGGQPHPY